MQRSIKGFLELLFLSVVIYIAVTSFYSKYVEANDQVDKFLVRAEEVVNIHLKYCVALRGENANSALINKFDQDLVNSISHFHDTVTCLKNDGFTVDEPQLWDAIFYCQKYNLKLKNNEY